MQDELARPDAAQQRVHRLDIQPGGRVAGAVEPFEHALLVVLGLQLADEPRPRVGEPLVVNVFRVLRADEHAQPEGPRLLKQPHQRLFGRRVVGVRREHAECLVDVQQRAQARRAGERAHPGVDGPEDQRVEELALGVVEVRGVEDRGARVAFRREQHRRDVERLALDPALEVWRRHDVVQLLGQLDAVLLGEDVLDVEHAELPEGGPLHLQNELRHRKVGALLPVVLENVGEQDVLAVLDGPRVDADERQQRRDEPLDALAQSFLVARPALFRGGEGLQDANGQPRFGARRVDAEACRAAVGLHAVVGDAPLLQPVAPAPGDDGGVLLQRVVGAGGVVGVHPRLVVLRREVREGEQHIGDVAFGVDDQTRDAVEHGLLENVDAETRLAAARHAEDDAVSRQVAGVVVDGRVVDDLVRLGVDLRAEIEVVRRLDEVHLLHTVIASGTDP